MDPSDDVRPGGTSPASRAGREAGEPAVDLRTALLDAAAEELTAHGPEGMGLRAIARRAGVSHAAPGYVFGGMQGMRTALAARGFTLLAERLEGARAAGRDEKDAGPERDVGPAAEASPLGRLGESYVHFAAQEPGLFALMFRTARLDGQDEALRAAQQRALAPLAAHADTPLRKVMIWSLAHGAAVLESEGQLAPSLPGEDPAGQVVRSFAQVLGE
ncbi:TetR family transcriptional regulator [Brachybacterium endophyticum]|uniref:TetR family transcriptional regulator n=1 Tax=Brachybacterium endophyticum TaxID=2182385 RepID=A0A2U2RML0_9MICO|nr:TetR/AcrR family transcriptional regulator [Brachybacterium endophyticum]PWH07102.1 TetR family transcriptional regulator [Brachybacterium endophyticum]